MDIIKYDSKSPSRQNSARLDTLFKGRAAVPIFEKQMHNARCLVRDLTGADIYEMGNNNPEHIYVRPTNLEMRSGTGSVELMIGASLFEPCISYDFESWGYSMQMFFRGSRDAVEKGFDDAITRLGFPGEVTPPSSLPQMYRLMGMDPSEIPNCAGWDIAKRVVKNHGAELKKVHFNMCRFPYNLLMRECEGRVLDKDLRILGDNTAEVFLRKFYVTD